MVLTTAELREMCHLALKRKFLNGPNDNFWANVDPDGFHVVGFWFVHRPCLWLWKGIKHEWDFSVGGGKNIRTYVLCKMKGRKEPVYLLCDFDHADFMKRKKLHEWSSSGRTVCGVETERTEQRRDDGEPGRRGPVLVLRVARRRKTEWQQR